VSDPSVLLKLSGSSFDNGEATIGAFDNDSVNSVANKIGYIAERLESGLAVVVGAGNIWRGRNGITQLDPVLSDQVGMTATVVNAMRLQVELQSVGVESIVMNAFGEVPGTRILDYAEARDLLSAGIVVIFGGGTGKPGVTTDTGATLHASGCNLGTIWFAKDDVDGIYDADPKKVRGAHRFDEIPISDILKQNLKVMDTKALEMGLEKGIGFKVFNGSPYQPWETMADEEPEVRFSLVPAA
jgi:uridylate kinase